MNYILNFLLNCALNLTRFGSFIVASQKSFFLVCFRAVKFIVKTTNKLVVLPFVILKKFCLFIFQSVVRFISTVYNKVVGVFIYLLKLVRAVVQSTKISIKRSLRYFKKVIYRSFRRFYIFLVSILSSKKTRILLTAFTFLIFVTLAGVYFYTVPNPTRIEDFKLPSRIVLTDRNGQLLYSSRAYSGDWISYNKIPPFLVDAVVASQDNNFFVHSGFDPIKTTSETFHNLFTRDNQRGLTITQQLAKKNISQKGLPIFSGIEEMIITKRIEMNFNKKQILEVYLNTQLFNRSAIGIQSAGEKYFGKRTSELSNLESAYLSSIISDDFDTFGNKKSVVKKADEVLSQMVIDKKISEDKKKIIEKDDLTVLPQEAYIRAPSFVGYVLDELTQKYGSETLENKSLIVKTSLDLNLQNSVQKAFLEQSLNTDEVELGAFISDSNNRDILTMVGPFDYFDTLKQTKLNLLFKMQKLNPFIEIIDAEVATYFKKESSLETQQTVSDLLSNKNKEDTRSLRILKNGSTTLVEYMLSENYVFGTWVENPRTSQNNELTVASLIQSIAKEIVQSEEVNVISQNIDNRNSL